jgi:hypothetical protein
VIIGIAVLEAASFARVFFLLLIVSGIVGLKFVAA